MSHIAVHVCLLLVHKYATIPELWVEVDHQPVDFSLEKSNNSLLNFVFLKFYNQA